MPLSAFKKGNLLAYIEGDKTYVDRSVRDERAEPAIF